MQQCFQGQTLLLFPGCPAEARRTEPYTPTLTHQALAFQGGDGGKLLSPEWGSPGGELVPLKLCSGLGPGTALENTVARLGTAFFREWWKGNH